MGDYNLNNLAKKHNVDVNKLTDFMAKFIKTTQQIPNHNEIEKIFYLAGIIKQLERE